MVKLTQTIRQLLPTNCLSVSDYFVGLALKGLKRYVLIYKQETLLLYPRIPSIYKPKSLGENFTEVWA